MIHYLWGLSSSGLILKSLLFFFYFKSFFIPFFCSSVFQTKNTHLSRSINLSLDSYNNQPDRRKNLDVKRQTHGKRMTTFSLMTLSIFAILVIIRYHKAIINSSKNILTRSGLLKNVAADDPSNVKRLAPYPAQPIRGRKQYRVMMDIRRLDSQNWLTLDKNYMEEHHVRDHLLREKKSEVLRCLPESLESCHEALEEVSEFLCQRFPNMFRKISENNQEFIENCMTGEKFDLRRSVSDGNDTDALEAAVRLTMEDLSILMLNEEGEYYL